MMTARSALGNLRIKLDESDFRTLVSGQQIGTEEGEVEIILADIGFDRMLQALHDAMAERWRDQ